MSDVFGGLYSVPAGQPQDPNLPPINLPQVDAPPRRQPLRVTVGPDRSASADPWAAAGIKITPSGKGDVTEASSDPWSAAGVTITPPGEYKPDTRAPAPEVGAGEAFGREAAQSTSFGTYPAIQGAIAAGQSPQERGISDEDFARHAAHDPIGAIGNQIGELVRGLKRLGFSDDEARTVYDQAREKAQSTLDAGREQHPYASMAGGLAGSVVTPLPGLGAASLGGRIARGALAGGLGGATYGAGSALSEGKDLSDIGMAAATQGVIGGVTGGAIGGVLGPRLRPALTSGERAAQTARDLLDAPLPRGVTSDIPLVQSTTARLRQMPLGGTRISSGVGRAEEAAGEHIGDIAAQMSGAGVTDRGAADALLRPGLETAISHNKARIDAGYNALRSVTDHSQRFDMPATRAILMRIRQDRAGAGWTNPSQGLEQFENVADGATLQNARRARADARNAGDVRAPHPGFDANDFRHLDTAMTSDMRRMAARGAHDQTPAGQRAAVDAFDAADRQFGPLADQNKLLKRLVDRQDESAVATLLRATTEKGGNVRLLSQLKRSMDPADFDVIGGQLLHELGHSNATNSFSLAKFVTDWTKVSDGAKRALFDPQHLRNIEAIAGMGEHVKGALRESSTSHSANLLVLMEVAREAWEIAHGLVTTGHLGAGALAGSAAAPASLVLTHWLATPSSASSMARWSAAHNAYVRRPSRITEAGFAIATRNLSHTVGVPAESIIRSTEVSHEEK